MWKETYTGKEKTTVDKSFTNVNNDGKINNKDYKEWYNDAERITRQRKIFEADFEKIDFSDEQLEGLKRYTGNGFYDINSFLRDREAFEKKKMFFGKLDEEFFSVEKAVKNIQSIMEKSLVREETVVGRKVSVNHLERLFGENWLRNPNAIIGKSVTSKGFVSTSLAPMTGAGADYFGKEPNLYINIPKGARAIYVEPISLNEGENGLLINSGSRFRITAVNVIDNKVEIYADLEKGGEQ